MTSPGYTLSSADLQTQLDAVQQAAALSRPAVNPEGFLFVACFDGTNNDRKDLPESETEIQTNVGGLFEMCETLYKNSDAGTARYYAGPGTKDSFLFSEGWPPAVTLEIDRQANNAYNDFVQAALVWEANNPDKDLSEHLQVAATGFSRGCATAVRFCQLLNENGFTSASSGQRVEIPVVATVLLDPVTTGYMNDLSIPQNVNMHNFVSFQARDEFRYAFKASTFGPGANVVQFVGNHGDVGGFYTNEEVSGVVTPGATTLQALGAKAFEAQVGFFRAAGIPLGPIPVERQFDSTDLAIINNEGVDKYGNVIWSTYGTVGSSPRLTTAVGTSYLPQSTPSFVYQAGQGPVTFTPEGTHHTLVVEGVASTSFTPYRRGNDLVVLMEGADRITVKGWYSSGGVDKPIKNIFVGSDYWLVDETFATAPQLIEGGLEDDVLSANPLLSLPAVFIGGRGNDNLQGSGLADAYVYRGGDGHDTITEQSDATGQLDKLQLSGLKLQDAGFARSGDDLRIVFAGGGSVTVKSWFPAGENRRIENVTFDDATLTADEVTARVGIVLDDGPNNYTGTNYNDIIYGLGGADNLSGDPYQGAADDVLHGGAGNDILYGGRGRDFLYGGADNDVLDGGNGADFLSGGPGADVLGGEYGQQTYDPGWYPSYGYTGEALGNTYDGGTGNDRLNGSMGADTYLFDLGWGADTLYEQDNPNLRVTDVIWFGAGISSADIRVSRQNLDLVLSHVNGQDSITLKSWFGNYTSTVKQVEEIRFQNGTVWSAASLTAQCQIQQGDDSGNKLDGLSGYANQLFGNGGADQVYGGGYNDLLVGGTGNDYLWGGNGSDTFQYFRGDGYDTVQDPSGSDRIVFEGITLSEAQFFRMGNDLEVFLGTGQGVRVTNHFGAYIGGPQPVEFLVFADQQVSSSQFNAWANPKA